MIKIDLKKIILKFPLIVISKQRPSQGGYNTESYYQ